MLRLGHITYSNCVPVHGRLLACGAPPGVELVPGVPGELNRRLARGEIQVAPASSIEFARHADRYRIVPGLSISAPAAVDTIRVLSASGLSDLRDGARIAVPTASATSVALLKIVVAQRFGIRADYVWFDQDRQDPFAEGADAALYIGDGARDRAGRAGLLGQDLGAIWNEWTGLPFVFAIWQVHAAPEARVAVRRLAGDLHGSLDWSMARLPELAERYAPGYECTAPALLEYWRTLEFGWSAVLESALLEFYGRADEIGIVAGVPRPSYLEM